MFSPSSDVITYVTVYVTLSPANAVDVTVETTLALWDTSKSSRYPGTSPLL